MGLINLAIVIIILIIIFSILGLGGLAGLLGSLLYVVIILIIIVFVISLIAGRGWYGLALKRQVERSKQFLALPLFFPLSRYTTLSIAGECGRSFFAFPALDLPTGSSNNLLLKPSE